MNKHLFFGLAVLLGIAASTWSACEIINPAEDIPAYVYVEALDLVTDTLTEGSASHRITEAWITIDGEFIGAFPLPALVPVLKSGMQRLYIEAGIKDNGISASPEIYPFYEPVEIDVDLKPALIDTIRPEVRYRPGIRFSILEGFEGTSHAFQDLRNGNEAARMQLSSTGAFEGQRSGLIQLDTANSLIELATLVGFRDLAANGIFVYLEMNYRSDVPVVFGLIGKNDGIFGNEQAIYDPGFAPREQWNKIYFNLTAMVLEGNFDEYRVGLVASLPLENGKFTRNEAQIWLDNIKLVHF